MLITKFSHVKKDLSNIKIVIMDKITEIIVVSGCSWIIGKILDTILKRIQKNQYKIQHKTVFIRKAITKRLIKAFIVSLLYVFPLIGIISLIVEDNKEFSFRNIALFIILCLTLVFNYIMGHIITIYKMNSELISKLKD
jgi:hypothetical protein